MGRRLGPRARVVGDRRTTAVAALVGLIALTLCRAAMLPGIWFWDTAEYQTVGPVLGVAHPTGFPAYVILSWLASVVFQPLGEPAFRVNLLSGICVAVAASTVVLIARELSGTLVVAATAGIGFATSEAVWRIGTSADAHALHVALVALLFAALVAWQLRHDSGDAHADRWLVAAAAIGGVALANHSLTLLLIPAAVIYVVVVEARVFLRPRLVAACLLASVGLAALLYLELPLRAGPFRAPLVYAHPETPSGFLYVVLGEQFRGSFTNPLRDLGKAFAGVSDTLVSQFGILTVLIPAAFLATLVRYPKYALLTGVSVATTLAFNAAYANAVIERYYLGPILIAWTWVAVLAAAVLDTIAPLVETDPPPADGVPAVKRAAVPSRLRPTVTVELVASLAIAAALLLPVATSISERWKAVNQSGDTGARRWLEAALATLAPNAVVVSWWDYSTPLWYGQLVEGRRPDLTVIDDRTRLDQGLGEASDVIDAQLGKRTVYVIRLPRDLAALQRRFEMEPVPGVWEVYLVTGRKANAA